MIAQDYDSTYLVDELLRKIRIRESQLKIAQSSNLVYSSQALQNQLSELRHQLSDSPEPELQALMSLLDD
jgi:hypothetical protein